MHSLDGCIRFDGREQERHTKHTKQRASDLFVHKSDMCSCAHVHAHSLIHIREPTCALLAIFCLARCLVSPTLMPRPYVAEVRLSASFLRREFSVVFAFDINVVFAFLRCDFSLVCGFGSLCCAPAARLVIVLPSAGIPCARISTVTTTTAAAAAAAAVLAAAATTTTPPPTAAAAAAATTTATTAPTTTTTTTTTPPPHCYFCQQPPLREVAECSSVSDVH